MRINDDHVLFHCTGAFGYGNPLLALLDLRSGQEVYREVPPEGVTHDGAYLYANQLIVIEGEFDPDKEPRHRSTPKRLIRRDLTGELIGVNDEVPEEVEAMGRWLESGVAWDGLFFYNDKGDRVLIFPSEHVLVRPRTYLDLGWGIADAEAAIFVQDGQLVSWKISHRNSSNARDVLHLLEYRSGNGTWTSLLPTVSLPRYDNRESLVAVATWGDTLIVGTNYGRVECLQRDTGESLWTYIFPYTRFYGGVRGPIPYKSDLDQEHRRRNQRLENPGMFTPLNDIKALDTRETGRQVLHLLASPPPPAQIHYDPLPGPWFQWLWMQQVMAWVVALAVAGGNFLLFRRAWRKRRALPGVLWLTLLLWIASGLSLLFVGWIDRPSHATLLTTITLTGGNFVFHVVRNWVARNWRIALSGTLVAGALAFSVYSSL